MSDQPENQILAYLRRMDLKLDRLTDDVQDLKRRMSPVEEGLAGVNRRFDRLEDCVIGIARRLDLAGAVPK